VCSMVWVFVWRRHVTQQLLSVQRHLSLILVNVPTPNVLTADVLRTDIFSLKSRVTKKLAASRPAPLFCFFFLHFLPHKFHFTRTRQQSTLTLQYLSRSSTNACIIPAYKSVSSVCSQVVTAHFA